jgi:hypothetical protein
VGCQAHVVAVRSTLCQIILKVTGMMNPHKTIQAPPARQADFAEALDGGLNVMDLSRRVRTAQAGYNQGKALAEQLSDSL